MPNQSELQRWINEWTKVPGAEDLDIEAAHRLGCFDGAMWLLEQLQKWCEMDAFGDRLLDEHTCDDSRGRNCMPDELVDYARKLCGKQGDGE